MIDDCGGGDGITRLTCIVGDGRGLAFVVDSFGSDTARVLADGNCVVITTGLVLLFELNANIGGALGALLDDGLIDGADVGIGGGLFIVLETKER